MSKVILIIVVIVIIIGGIYFLYKRLGKKNDSKVIPSGSPKDNYTEPKKPKKTV